MDFPFGPLAPDRGEYSPGSLQAANGCVPLEEGYGPFPSLAVASGATALATAPRGMISYQDSSNAWKTVAGEDTKIRLLGSDYTWSDLDTGLTPTTGDDFSFCRFGTKLLYSNTTDGLKAVDVDSAAVTSVSAAKAPRWIFECGNILFGLDCLDSASNRNRRLIRSSAYSDHTNWTTKGADYQPLDSGGSLIWGGRLSDTAALILQTQQVRLIQVGNAGSSPWGLVSVSQEFGSVGARSVVAFDGAVYWLATDGFRRFTLAKGIERIGAGFIDQWFLNNLDQSDMSLVQGTIDPFRKCVLWRYKSLTCGSSTVFNDIIGYYWPTGRWFTLSVDTAYLAYAASSAVTWATFPGTWATADVAWDSRSLQGGQPLLGAINSSYKFGYFASSNLAATFETSVADSPIATMINWAKPIDDSADGTLSLGVKQTLSDDTTWKTGVAKTPTGWAGVRGLGEEIAFKRLITAGSTWTYAKGIDYVRTARPGPR